MTEETKAEKFKRVANPRFEQAIKRIRLMKKLANTDSYEYTDKQVETIIDTLHQEVNDLHAAFRGEEPNVDVPEL